MICAIVFDLDETLLDHTQTQEKACFHLYNQYFKKRCSFSQFQRYWKHESDRLWIAYRLGQITIEERRVQRMQSLSLQFLNQKVNEEEAAQMHQEYIQFYEQNAQIFPDVLPCFQRLSNYKLGIITNGNVKSQRKKIKSSGLMPYLSATIISEEVGIRKPDPEIFRICLNQLEIDAKQAIMVGDRLDKDVIGATRIGISGIWIDRKNQMIPQIYSEIVIIRTLDEIPEAITLLSHEE
ncbi:HAD family hydrolase [Thermoflavimicrobium daqui]|nr:HAD family hydrolase [Thermoflavimicrobium daqui]